MNSFHLRHETRKRKDTDTLPEACFYVVVRALVVGQIGVAPWTYDDSGCVGDSVTSHLLCMDMQVSCKQSRRCRAAS